MPLPSLRAGITNRMDEGSTSSSVNYNRADARRSEFQSQDSTAVLANNDGRHFASHGNRKNRTRFAFLCSQSQKVFTWNRWERDIDLVYKPPSSRVVSLL